MPKFELLTQGETLDFFSDPDPTAERVEFEVHMAPGASGPDPHRHPRQREVFTVLEGVLLTRVDGAEERWKAGQVAEVPVNAVHTFANGSDSEVLVVRAVVEPALNFQWFLSESAASAIRGGGSWRDMSLLEVGWILHRMKGEYRLSGMPDRVQDALFLGLATLADLSGRSRRIAPMATRQG